MPTVSENTLLMFKYICNFIYDLNEVFGKEKGVKSLVLYAHLVEKTGIMHEEPIKKHVSLFYDFIKQNEDAIVSQDVTQLNPSVIQYSDKVFIDIAEIFDKSDREEKPIVWKHLLTLAAVLDPSSQAKKLLKEEQDRKKEKGESGNEENFLSNLIDKVGSQIDPNVSSPTDMMNNILQSGVFNDLVGSMNDGISTGNLDLNKMIGTLQNMIGTLNTASTGNEH